MSDPAALDRAAFRAEIRRAAYPDPPPSIAPDLVNPHEPGPLCGGTHCWSHGTDESAEGAWRTCFECGHVYRSQEELRREWTENAPPDLRDEPAPPVDEIYFCCLCLHDW